MHFCFAIYHLNPSIIPYQLNPKPLFASNLLMTTAFWVLFKPGFLGCPEAQDVGFVGGFYLEVLGGAVLDGPFFGDPPPPPR